MVTEEDLDLIEAHLIMARAYINADYDNKSRDAYKKAVADSEEAVQKFAELRISLKGWDEED